MIDWDMVLADVSWFNFSAISPALNENIADVCLKALEAASAKKIKIELILIIAPACGSMAKNQQE